MQFPLWLAHVILQLLTLNCASPVKSVYLHSSRADKSVPALAQVWPSQCVALSVPLVADVSLPDESPKRPLVAAVLLICRSVLLRRHNGVVMNRTGTAVAAAAAA